MRKGIPTCIPRCCQIGVSKMLIRLFSLEQSPVYYYDSYADGDGAKEWFNRLRYRSFACPSFCISSIMPREGPSSESQVNHGFTTARKFYCTWDRMFESWWTPWASPSPPKEVTLARGILSWRTSVRPKWIGILCSWRSPLCFIKFSFGCVCWISDWNRYHGRRIDGLGPRRELPVFLAVPLAWI